MTKEKAMEMKWNLDDILPENQFDELYSEIERDLKKFRGYYKKMDPKMDKEDFREFMEFDEAMTEKVQRLMSMPGLMEAADQRSEKAKLLNSKTEELSLIIHSAGIKIGHWMIGKSGDKRTLDDKNAKRLFSSVPDIEYTLNRARDSERYILSEAEEKIITAKDSSGVGVLIDLRSLIETDFTFFFKPKGAKKGRTIKTLAEIISYTGSNKPKERKAGYMAFLTQYKENLDKFFMIYQAVVKDWVHDSKLRGFKSSISMRNHGNDIPDEAVKTLLDVCTENAGIYHDYFRLKARELGMAKLRRFDVYAPLKSVKKDKIPFDKAIEMVLNTFEEFSPRFAEKAKKIIDKKHIDSHPNPTKQFGAFCNTITPKIEPYILLNHTGTLRDVSTLAHELGHGIHSLYANHHSVSSQQASLPLSETASTLLEMVMFEKLLEQAENDQVRKALLSGKMADSFGTVLRQNYFVKFEIKAHEAIEKGITGEGLSDIYYDELKEQFGDSLSIDDIFRYEWAYIPHIVQTPFYCYAYSFGDLLSLALFSEYKKQGHVFIPKIEKILAYGGSKAPQKVLNEVGVDINSRNFWQGSFDIVREWQKQLESYEG